MPTPLVSIFGGGLDRRRAISSEVRQWASCLFLTLAIASGGCQSSALVPVGSSPGKFVPEEDERRLWNRAREEQRRLDGSGLLYEDPSLTEYLNSVARRLLPDRATDAGASVEVRVIKDPALNAFALPNGLIYVHTGLLARMNNEDQLATLLGHEMTHVTHRHAIRQFRDVQNKTAILAGLQVVAAPFGAIGSMGSVLGAVGTLAAVYGYSQVMETEADREGFARMVEAGYDPREAPKLFLHLKQWAEEEKKPEPFFFNTHPRLAERIENYQVLNREVQDRLARRESHLREGEFRRRTRLLLLDNALLDLQRGRFLQAQNGLKQFIALSPGDPRAYFYLGETYRRQSDPKESAEAFRLYQAALALDHDYPDPYRGLGTLYYQEGKTAEAAAAFDRYLELAPAAADRGHIERLLKEVRK